MKLFEKVLKFNSFSFWVVNFGIIILSVTYLVIEEGLCRFEFFFMRTLKVYIYILKMMYIWNIEYSSFLWLQREKKKMKNEKQKLKKELPYLSFSSQDLLKLFQEGWRTIIVNLSTQYCNGNINSCEIFWDIYNLMTLFCWIKC